MRLAERAVVTPALRSWLRDALPGAEFAHELAQRPDVVAEVVDAGATRAVLVGDERLTTLSGAPHFLAVVGEDDASVLRLAPVVVRLLRADDAVELLGPGEHPRLLADHVAARAGGSVASVMQQRLWSARAVRTPRGVEGRPRRARRADRRLLAGWLDDFSVEALGAAPRGPAVWLDQVAAADDGLWVWEVDGRATSLVHTRRTSPVSSRIGPVWTPPPERGNGYAAALTAHVTKRCLVEGDERVVLLTDVENPVSNRLYARIGYQEVCAHASWVVRTRDAGRGAPSG